MRARGRYGRGLSRCAQLGITEQVAALVLAVGGVTEVCDLTLCDFDLVVIAQLPDTVALASLVMRATSSGLLAGIESVPLLTTEEAALAAEQALRLALGGRAVSASETAGDGPDEPVVLHDLGRVAPVERTRPKASQPPQGPLVPEWSGEREGVSADVWNRAPPAENRSAGEQAPRETYTAPAMPSEATTARLPDMDDLQGAYDISAGPFARFSDLGEFTQVLNGVPGVLSISTKYFDRGRVGFRVRYDNAVPLLTRLRELPQFKGQMSEVAPHRIEFSVSHAAPVEAPAGT